MSHNRKKHEQHKQSSDSNKEQSVHDKQNGDSRCPLRFITGTEEHQHRLDEKAYWLRQLCISRWLNWITGVGTFVGLFGLLFLYGTLKATKTAADAAESAANTAAKQLDMSERPWITVDTSLQGPLVIDASGLSITAKVATHNTGNSPATTVLAETRLKVRSGWSGTEISNEQNALCNDLKQRAMINQNRLETFFPKTEQSPQLWALRASRSDLDEAIKSGNGRVIPLILTCVVYRATFNDAFRNTAYLAIVDNAGMTIVGTQYQTISEDRLHIQTETHAD